MVQDFIKKILVVMCLALLAHMGAAKVYSAPSDTAEQANDIKIEPQNGHKIADNTLVQPADPSMVIDPSYYQAGQDKGQMIQIVLVPRFESTLSTQITAKINNIFFKEGDSFQQDDLLIQFDCDVNKANRDKAEAEFLAAEKQLKINRRLNELASLSRSELGKAEAEYKKAQAELDRINAIVKFCDIRAPFSGRVAEMLVNNYETVSQGKEVVKIIDDTSLQIEMFVPSSWLIWLKKGSKFKVKVDETGLEYPGKVISMGARIDSVSQSLKIVGELDGAFPELIAGMGGQAYFVVPENKNE